MSVDKDAHGRPASFLSRLPGVRRYAIENQRLRSALAKERDLIRQLRAEQQRTAQDTALLRQAKEHDYYLANAFKKIDIRQLRPFGDLAARVIRDQRTYLNVDRLYTLWQTVLSLPSSAHAVAEVGVYRGGSAWFMAQAMRLHGREMPFYACDTFQGHVEVDDTIDGLHAAGKQFVKVKVERVARYLRQFPFVRVVQGDIRETVRTFDSERAFGLVHLDVDVYPITCFCLEFFAARMAPAGTMIVDDYGTTTCEGVNKAVDEFAARHANFRVLHLLTGQALVMHLPQGPG